MGFSSHLVHFISSPANSSPPPARLVDVYIHFIQNLSPSSLKNFFFSFPISSVISFFCVLVARSLWWLHTHAARKSLFWPIVTVGILILAFLSSQTRSSSVTTFVLPFHVFVLLCRSFGPNKSRLPRIANNSTPPVSSSSYRPRFSSSPSFLSSCRRWPAAPDHFRRQPSSGRVEPFRKNESTRTQRVDLLFAAPLSIPVDPNSQPVSRFNFPKVPSLNVNTRSTSISQDTHTMVGDQMPRLGERK